MKKFLTLAAAAVVILPTLHLHAHAEHPVRKEVQRIIDEEKGGVQQIKDGSQALPGDVRQTGHDLTHSKDPKKVGRDAMNVGKDGRKVTNGTLQVMNGWYLLPIGDAEVAAIDAARPFVQKAAKKGAETVAEASEAAKDAASQAKDAAQNGANQAKDAAQQGAQDFQNAVNDTASHFPHR